MGGVTDLPKRSHPVTQFLAETFFLFTRWQYLVPFLLNMCGSVVFFWSLGSAEISLVVPITNSLTFLFTTATSQLLGETRGVNRCTKCALSLFLPSPLTHAPSILRHSSYTRRHGSRLGRSVHLC